MLRSQRGGKGSRWRWPHPRSWCEVFGFLAVFLLGFVALAYVLDWLKGVLWRLRFFRFGSGWRTQRAYQLSQRTDDMEQKQPEKKKRGKRYVLVGGVLVMLLVCFLLGVIVGQRDGEPQTALRSSAASPGPTSTAIPSETAEPPETATLTKTAEPTMTPEATWTPTPTATLPPTFTATPEPTETAEPTRTATPVPVATAVLTETAWLILTLAEWDRWTRGEIEIIADASLTMGSLMMKPLPEDTKWVALVDLQVAKLREADAGLRDIVPPGKVRHAHEMLLSASGDFLLGAEYALKGAIEQDRDLLEQATEYTASGDAKFNLFVLMIEAMTP